MPQVWQICRLEVQLETLDAKGNEPICFQIETNQHFSLGWKMWIWNMAHMKSWKILSHSPAHFTGLLVILLVRLFRCAARVTVWGIHLHHQPSSPTNDSTCFLVCSHGLSLNSLHVVYLGLDLSLTWCQQVFLTVVWVDSLTSILETICLGKPHLKQPIIDLICMGCSPREFAQLRCAGHSKGRCLFAQQICHIIHRRQLNITSTWSMPRPWSCWATEYEYDWKH